MKVRALLAASSLVATSALAGKPESEAAKAYQAARDDVYMVLKTKSGYRYFATEPPPCSCPTVDFVVSCEADLKAKLETEKKAHDDAEGQACPKKCKRAPAHVYVECKKAEDEEP
jgi:hypothetical protein